MTDYDKDLDDKEVDEAIAEQRHFDMMRLLGKIADTISIKNDKVNAELQSLVNNNKTLFGDILSKVKELQSPTIEIKQDEIILASQENGQKTIDAINENTKAVKELQLCIEKNAKVKTEFQITERNSQGFASKIIATPK